MNPIDKRVRVVGMAEIGNMHTLGETSRATDLLNILKMNPSCTEIDASHYNIGVNGAKDIALLLKVNTSLTCIDLSQNNIGVQGARYIAEALKVNTSLAFINLSGNSIQVDGMKYITDALKVTKSLTHINLSLNNIRNDGVKLMTDALKMNKSLVYINLDLNNVGVRGAKYIAEVLKVNTRLCRIDIRWDGFVEDEGYTAEEFEADTSLNGVGEEGCDWLGVQSIIQNRIRRNLMGIERARKASLYIMLVRERQPIHELNGYSGLTRLPKEIALIIAKMVWGTKGCNCWVKGLLWSDSDQ